MTMNSVTRVGHPVMFGALVLFSIIEMAISAWLTTKYKASHSPVHSDLKTRVHYLLFVSVWTIVLGTVYLVTFLVASTNIVASVASHLAFLALTWIFWVAGAAAITQALGGTLNCSTQEFFIYCGQLNALLGFAWLIWVLVTLILVFVLFRGITSAKQGDGFDSALVDD